MQREQSALVRMVHACDGDLSEAVDPNKAEQVETQP